MKNINRTVPSKEILIETKNIVKEYTSGRNKIRVLDNVSIKIYENQTVGLFGDSGSGKSTLAQIISGLVKYNSGNIYYKNNILRYPIKKSLRNKIQILFQQPEISFNPKIPLYKSLEEPYKLMGKETSIDIITDDIKKFGLNKAHILRTPKELSGGELQRAALLRVMTMNPELIILDEPTSMLDLISQAQIIYFLKEYQKLNKTSFLLISHDIKLLERVSGVVYRINDGICVL